MEVREIIHAFTIYVVPLIAITVSIFSFYESRKVNRVQFRLSEIEEQLKKYELEDRIKAKQAAKEAKVEARVYNISKGNYKLKIWNSGQATAYNVDYEVPIELSRLIFREKVPFEVLESGKSFDEHIVFFNDMSRKFSIKTIWKDEADNAHEKEQIISF